MKKGFKQKIPVIITSLIQLVILLRAFILPERFVVDMVEDFKSSIGFAIFVMVIEFAIILFDEIKYNKTYIFASNILLFFSAPLFSVRIITIVNLLLLAFIKPEHRPKIKLKEACKILQVDTIKWDKKKWMLLLALLVIYFGQNFIKAEWLELLSPIGLIIYIIGIHVLLMMLSILTFYNEIKEGAKLISKNFKLTIRYMLKLFVKMLLIMIVATMISVLVTNKMSSVNQESIESMPLYMTIPLAVIWAPFVEEAVFRGGIRKFVKHKLLFIIVSGVVFGFLHAIGEATFAYAVATSLPYIAIGMVFAYSYARTNNLAVNILFHMLYNTLAVLASILK